MRRFVIVRREWNLLNRNLFLEGGINELVSIVNEEKHGPYSLSVNMVRVNRQHH